MSMYAKFRSISTLIARTLTENGYIVHEEGLDTLIVDTATGIACKVKISTVKGASEEMARLLAKNVDDLELSVRAANALLFLHVHTVGELVLLHEYDILKVRKAGKKTLNLIKTVLAEMGLHLGMRFSIDA